MGGLQRIEQQPVQQSSVKFSRSWFSFESFQVSVGVLFIAIHQFIRAGLAREG